MALSVEDLAYLDRVSRSVLQGMVIAQKVPFQGAVIQSAAETSYRVALSMLDARKGVVKEHGLEEEVKVDKVEDKLEVHEVDLREKPAKKVEPSTEKKEEKKVEAKDKPKKRGRPKKPKNNLKMHTLLDDSCNVPNPF